MRKLNPSAALPNVEIPDPRDVDAWLVSAISVFSQVIDEQINMRTLSQEEMLDSTADELFLVCAEKFASHCATEKALESSRVYFFLDSFSSEAKFVIEQRLKTLKKSVH